MLLFGGLAAFLGKSGKVAVYLPYSFNIKTEWSLKIGED
jgi:hypothetical protein